MSSHSATKPNKSQSKLTQTHKKKTSSKLSETQATELMLLIAAFEIEKRDLAVWASVLLAGAIPKNFPINIWHSAVWLTLASSASYVLRDDAEWQTANALLSPVRTTPAKVTNHHGDIVYELHSGLLNKAMVYPLKMTLVILKELTGHLRNARGHWAWRQWSFIGTKLTLPQELISTDKTSTVLPWPRWSRLPNATGDNFDCGTV